MEKLTEMPSRKDFCDILNIARTYHFKGSWEGSAYRKHPCGIIRGTIKLTNDWTTYNDCSVMITDGEGWGAPECNDSRMNGNPYPQPINGSSIFAWGGEWASTLLQLKLEPKVLEILNEAIAFNEEKALEREKEKQQKMMEEESKQKALVAKAIERLDEWKI